MDLIGNFMWFFLLLIALAIFLFWWNRKQLRRPRDRWERFAEKRRKSDDD